MSQLPSIDSEHELEPPVGQPVYRGGVTDGNLLRPMRLREFLTGVGTVFRLDQKERKRRTDSTTAKKGFALPAIRLPRNLVMGTAAVLFIAFIATNLGAAAGQDHLPPEVLGEWGASTGRYAGRTFFLTDKEVRFYENSEKTAGSASKIQKVLIRQAGDTTYFTVEYLEARNTVSWSWNYFPYPKPSIRFNNLPEIIWRPVGAAPAKTQ